RDQLPTLCFGAPNRSGSNLLPKTAARSRRHEYHRRRARARQPRPRTSNSHVVGSGTTAATLPIGASGAIAAICAGLLLPPSSAKANGSDALTSPMEKGPAGSPAMSARLLTDAVNETIGLPDASLGAIVTAPALASVPPIMSDVWIMWFAVRS